MTCTQTHASYVTYITPHAGALRQTPEEVHALVKAAVSVPRASLEHTFSSAGSAENGRSGSVGVSHPAQQTGALGLMGVAQSTAAGSVTMSGVSQQHGPLTPRHPQGNNAGTSQHPITQYGTPSGSPAAMAGPGPGPGSMHEQCQQGYVGQLDSSSLGLSDDLLNASMFLGGPGGPVGALSGPMGQPFPVMQPQSIGDLADLNTGRSQHSDGQNVLLDSSILFDLTSGMH